MIHRKYSSVNSCKISGPTPRNPTACCFHKGFLYAVQGLIDGITTFPYSRKEMRTKTLTDHIYEDLKRDIFEIRIKPGEKLTELQLAEKYKVSRAPIREVIAKLKQDGLVVVKPQIGTIVSQISLSRANEVLQVRLLLEPYAAKIAAANITEKDIDLLNYTFKQIEIGRKKKDAPILLYFKKDETLHQTVWRLCGNEIIKSFLENYRYEIYRIRILYPELAEKLVPADDIREMSQSLFRKSPDDAQAAMKKHLVFVKDTIMSFLESDTRKNDDNLLLSAE